MRSSRWAGLALGLALGMLAVPVARAAEVNIGYVDLQRALNESKAGKKAKADFKGQVDKLEKTLKDKKEELDNLRAELEKKSVVMREDERRKLESDFEHKRLDLKRRFEDSQGMLQKKDQELTAQIIGELQKIIKQLGDQKGYTLILELGASSVLYYNQSDDLTEEVLKIYDGRS